MMLFTSAMISFVLICGLGVSSDLNSSKLISC